MSKNVLKLPLMGLETAVRASAIIAQQGIICPPDRVLIAILDEEQKIGSIIIPGKVAEEEALKKGVVISMGNLTEEYRSYPVGIGTIITYGDYAGKEVYLEKNIPMLDRYKLCVLSMHEIALMEINETL